MGSAFCEEGVPGSPHPSVTSQDGEKPRCSGNIGLKKSYLPLSVLPKWYLSSWKETRTSESGILGFRDIHTRVSPKEGQEKCH